MIGLAVLAHLLMPEVALLSTEAREAVAVVSIVAFFGLSFLLRQPMRYLSFRTIALCLIASGVFASPNFVPRVLELVSIDIPRERSYTVSNILLLAGLAILATYWLLNFFDYLRNRRTSGFT